MQRTARVFLPVVGAATPLGTAFDGDPERWLAGSRRDGPHGYTLTLRGGSFSREVRMTVGAPWRSASAHWRAISWTPIAADGEPAAVDRLLPTLEGELGLHTRDEDRVSLVLDARYEPPGGQFGRAVDAVALHQVARRTLERFLEDVGARLTAEAVMLGEQAHPQRASARG